MRSAAPEVLYARSGDVHVAYQVVGGGPVDIVVVSGFVTNLHVLWEEPGYRRFCERLGSFARVLLFDKRGMGTRVAARGESSCLQLSSLVESSSRGGIGLRPASAIL